jgi:hypothetical protein
MKLGRRLVGAVVLLLSTVGTVGCVAGAIGIWMLWHGASQKVHRISDRLDVGLEHVSAASQNVQRALVTARADVAAVGKESADLSGGTHKSRPAARATRALIRQKLGPHVDDLGGRLATLSEGAVAVSSLLQSLQELPLAQASRIDPDQLQCRADEVQQLSAILRRLETTLGDGDKETSSQEVAATTSQVDLVLERSEATIADWQSSLDAARDDLASVKAKLLGWLTCAAIAVTVLCAWAAAGQACLFARALRWCRGT